MTISTSGTEQPDHNPSPSTPGVAAAAVRLDAARTATLDEQVSVLTEVHDSLREALNSLDGA